MKYCIRDIESGALIDVFDTPEAAQAALEEYKKADEEDGMYDPDYEAYEITEE